MKPSETPGVLICAGDEARLNELRRHLEAQGRRVTGHLLGAPDPERIAAYQLVVVDGAAPEALALCRRLRGRLEEVFVPVLFVSDDPGPAAHLASFEAGADACLLRPFGAGELTAQVAALVRIKEIHDRLLEKSVEINRINKRLQQAYQQIDQELELAQHVQASFLPQSLPQVPHVKFAVHYLLCGRVGGDFYDIFRLDERHVGFYVADVAGHGVPASLLTIFIKKGVRPKEVFGNQYRLVPPGEVLLRLNRDLVEQKLSDPPFITMVYGLFNHFDGTIRFSRAGHPYPLLVPRQGPMELWKQDGFLLGVMDARYPCGTHQLHPGDKLLFYSDGVDHAAFEDKPGGLDSLLACAEKHRDLPVQDFVARLSRELFSPGAQADDLTLLGLERCE